MAPTMSGAPEHHDRAVVDRLRDWGIVSWALIGLLVLGGVTLWALLQIQDVFPPLVLALVIIYVVNPLVSRLERRGVHRLVGSCLGYAIFFALLAVALSFLVPVFVQQGRAFADEFPRIADRVGELGSRFSVWAEDTFDRTFDVGDWVATNGPQLLQGLVGRSGGLLAGALHAVVLIVIGPIIAFYLLIDLPRLQRSAVRLVPPERREESIELAGAIGKALGGFFRGQLVVALVVGIMSAVALRILGLPFWLVIGMIAGLFNLIPLVGPYIGGIPAVLIAAAFKPPITVVWVALALTIVQQIDNHLISPNVMRWAVKLHPVSVMLSLIAGATIAGLWGMLVAVPIVGVVKVVASHIWRTRVPWGEDVFVGAEPPPGYPGAHSDRDPHPAPAEDARPPDGPAQQDI